MTKAGATMWRLYLIFFAAASLSSAQGWLSGPSLGLLFDPQAQTIRNLRVSPGQLSLVKAWTSGFPSQMQFSRLHKITRSLRVEMGR